MRAPDFWSRCDWTAQVAANALAPLGWLYGAATDWKRRHTQPYTAHAKVICVGNLTVGGSGKTPVVLAITRMLQARQLQPVILSRGYGGRVVDAMFVDRAVHRVADVGDEPLLLAAAAPVIVARDRRRGTALADAHGADVIVMDDGHQNFALAKNLSIVLVDAVSGFGNGRILPAGPLREFVRNGLARAGAVVLVGEGSPALPGYSGPVLRARLVPSDGSVFSGRKLVAFAGIGRPEKFFATLRTLHADLVGTISFGDHHVFHASEIARLKAKARNNNAMLITTEKDYVRLTPVEREGISVLPIRAQFDQPDVLQGLLDGVVQKIMKKSA
ncbi:MAG: tetraacyldisaccharide 4'-kinase [Rhizomicrobium sp.]